MEGRCEVAMNYRLFLLLFCCLVCSCSKEKNHKQHKVITVTATTYVNSLFYSGIIEPIATTVMSSPADGVIVNMGFQYGDYVEKEASLFKISSTKFVTDYKNTLLMYVKSKNDFTIAKNQLSEAKFLHDNQLIPDDEFKAKQ